MDTYDPYEVYAPEPVARGIDRFLDAALKAGRIRGKRGEEYAALNMSAENQAELVKQLGWYPPSELTAIWPESTATRKWAWQMRAVDDLRNLHVWRSTYFKQKLAAQRASRKNPSCPRCHNSVSLMPGTRVVECPSCHAMLGVRQ